ncbi:hypothetical protein OpiT1DRAFT_04213 [Opitutaceae bacterium TAV1]|nr:hypothetical protein OpiT1DRAFT_04213 [Opitutaceae bacterium TAV1]
MRHLLLPFLIFNSQFLIASAAAPQPPTFADFTGVCQLGANNAAIIPPGMIGWDRADVLWDNLEPAPGDWHDDVLEKWGQRVLALREHGVEFLPILCYTARWAVDTTPRTTFETDTTRTVLERKDDGRLVVLTYKKAHNGSWVRESAAVTKPRMQWAIAPDHVPAWENYVRRVVTYLSAPPYNVRYFQIWNEAHPRSSFWQHASMDDYMTRIHLPAARIIRESGGPDAKVVYGGWPDCGPIQEYIDMLDRHDAWKTIDVHDIHYLPISAFEKIQAAARERGLGSVPLWQTEIGFVRNTATIPDMWPRFIAWSLRQGWAAANRDDYKLFWFPAWTPDAPASYGYGRALLHGQSLSAHGQAMRTLAQLFGDSPLVLYTDPVTTTPALTRNGIAQKKDGVEIFLLKPPANPAATTTPSSATPDRILAVFHLNREKGRKLPEAITLSLPQLPSSRIASVRRIDMAGHATPVESPAGTNAFRIPTADAPESPTATLFTNATVQTIYVELTLSR